jgi:glycosyltransferase involved in cell wall biosynthesis
MKKVMILHNYTEDSFAAMSYHLANDLSEKGHEVLFLSHRPYHAVPKQINPRLKVQCWSTYKRPTYRPSDLWLVVRLLLTFRPDIVIAHFAGSNLVTVLSKLLSFGRTRTYVYYHTLSSQVSTDLTARGNPVIKRLLFRLLTLRKGIFYRIFCDHVLPNSHLAYTDYVNYYGLNNGIEHITPLKDRYTGLKIDAAGPLRVAYLGRLDQSKGMDILLEAVRELKQAYGNSIAFEFAGRGHFEQELKQLDAEGLVSFIGFLDYDKVDAFLERNDVFLIPSYSDNLVTVGIEVMMKERCLIISRATGLSYYLKDGVDCLQIEPTRAAITERLQYLMEHREEVQRIADGGRQTFLDRFSIPSYLEFMNRILPLGN